MSRNILFLLSHQPNPRFIKQINFLSSDHNVSVVYYHREYLKDLFCEFDKNIVLHKVLNTINNGRYIKRIGDYIYSIKTLKKVFANTSFDVVIVNNIDTLALLKLSTIFLPIKPEIVIEISDLRSHTYTDNLKSKMIRFFEKWMFMYADKLIVTSAKFYEIYYHKIFTGDYFLLENKPLKDMIPKKIDKKNSSKVVIGIVGLLLQKEPYRALFETLKGHDKYEVHIYGRGIYQNLVIEYAEKYSNIIYHGEYNFFKDSADIYAALDILYMPYDTTNGSLNNKVALPNKFYEAIYFEVPILTSKDTYLAQLVQSYGIGETVACCDKKDLIIAIEKIIDHKEQYLKAFRRLDKRVYIADEDYQELEKYLLEGKK